MSENNSLFGNLVFSKVLKKSSTGKKMAYLAVFTALSVVTNAFIEIKLFDLQFSLTIFFSALIGVFLGGTCGFVVCLLGDFIGYVLNSWGQFYMPWVGVSTGLFAFFAAIIFTNIREDSYKTVLIKTALYTLVTFLICTVAVNSTGFYLYNKHVTGFFKTFEEYSKAKFGGNTGFFVYLIYRLFFKGQIWNSVANYTLLFVLLPALKRVKFFSDKF